MSFIECLDIVIEYTELFEACVFAACSPLFSILFLWCLLDFFDNVFIRRRISAMCSGFHNGTIKGFCRCHNCPYAKQCVYHVPRRSFSQWLRDLRKKKEP